MGTQLSHHALLLAFRQCTRVDRQFYIYVREGMHASRLLVLKTSDPATASKHGSKCATVQDEGCSFCVNCAIYNRATSLRFKDV